MTNLSKILTMAIIVLCSKSAFAQCDAPVNLYTAYDAGLNQSTFHWASVTGATAYRFQLKFPWDPWTAVEEVVSSEEYSFIGLAHSFPFEWRVSTICGNGESAFSPTQSYTVPCPTPSGLNATNITTNSATLNWTPFPGYNTYTAGFTLGYRIANSNAAWTSLGSTSVFTMNIAGLQASTTYEWCVNTSCTYFNSNPVIAQFTTAAGCGLPFNLRNSSTTHAANRVIWDAVNGATNYTVQYKKYSETNWTTVITSVNNALLQGLTQETLYDWKVRANCTAGNGVYSTPFQFHTYSAFCNSYGVNSSEFIDFVSLGTISRTSNKDICGYFNAAQSTTLVIGSSNNAGQLSAGFNPGIVFSERFAIYIDFNRNGNFADPGETVLPTLTANNGGNYAFSIAIPATATPGLAKMRVVMRRSGASLSPCGSGRGEVEDFVVNLATSVSNMALENNTATDDLENEIEDTSRSAATTADEKIVVSPNPGNGVFYVRQGSELDVVEYQVVNTVNSVLNSGQITSKAGFEVDLSQYASGVYFLVMTDGRGKSKVVNLMKI